MKTITKKAKSFKSSKPIQKKKTENKSGHRMIKKKRGKFF